MGGLRAVRKRHVWLLAPFVALVAPLSRTLGDNSFLWHVRAGTVQIEAGEVLRTDPFSYVASGTEWRTQSWLAELGYGWLESTFGGVGWSRTLVLFALVATGLLVMRRTERLGGTVATVFVMGLLFVLQTFVFAVPRPVLFSYPLLAAVVLMADDDDAPLWVLPGIIWLWAALHGSFVLGIGVVALDAARRRSGPRALAGLLAVVTASLTAHGLAIWQILLDFAGSRETLDLIEEWRRSDPTDVRLAPFFLVVVALVVLAATRRISMRDAVLAIPFALFGLVAVRNALPALIVVGPVAAAGLGSMVPALPRRDAADVPMFNITLMTILAGILVITVVQPRSFTAERFPTTDVVRRLEEGRVFHDDAVGGYLIWSVGPERQIYVDDRAELYGPDVFREMRGLLNGTVDSRRLDELSVAQALIARDEPLAEALVVRGWTERASDEYFVLLTR